MSPMPPFCRPEHTEGYALVPGGMLAPFQRNRHSTLKWRLSFEYWLVKSYWYASVEPLKVAVFLPIAVSVAMVGDPNFFALRPWAWSTGAPPAKSTSSTSAVGGTTVMVIGEPMSV